MAGQLIQCLILLSSCVRLCSKTTKPAITYMHQGIRCVKCAPGTYLIAHCDKEDEDASCKLCPNGSYSSEFNIATSCDPCKTVCEHEDLVPVTNCTYRTDMACACPEGKYNINAHLDLFHAKCMEYGKCGPGYGVKHRATSVSNTTCERCLVGRTYSPSTSETDRCQECKDCGQFDVISECNGTHDRTCKKNPNNVIIIPQSSNSHSKDEIYIPVGVAIGLAIAVAVAMFIYFCEERLPCCDDQNQRPNQAVPPVYTVSENYQMVDNKNGFGGLPEPSSPGSTLSISMPSSPTPTAQQPPYPTFVGQQPPLLVVRQPYPAKDVWNNNVSKIIMTLAAELINAHSWQRIIRQLYEDSGHAVEQADKEIKIAETTDSRNLPEQIYQCCIRWSKMPRASPDVLSQVLKNEDCKVILKVLRDKFPEVFPQIIESTV